MQLQATDLVFRGSRWLDIAVALRDEPRTLQQCARVLGVHSSVLYRQVGEMRRVGLLTCDGPESGRGARYRLEPSQIDALDRELAACQPVGQLRADQPVLFLEATSLLEVARALTLQDIAAPVVWAAQLDDDRFVLALDDKVRPVLRGRIRSALEAAGVSCRSGRVSQLVDNKAFCAYLASLRDAAM